MQGSRYRRELCSGEVGVPRSKLDVPCSEPEVLYFEAGVPCFDLEASCSKVRVLSVEAEVSRSEVGVSSSEGEVSGSVVGVSRIASNASRFLDAEGYTEVEG